ncbi:MAG: dipeptidase [Proteobacteria bacterium]|nr:dipeptidase [Pseudomonadota bacterium]
MNVSDSISAPGGPIGPAVLEYRDWSRDPAAIAGRLGISREAMELYLASEIVDLHVDSFIWTRLFGYDVTKRHGHGAFGASVYSQVDLPRLREARVGGAMWVITTNPWRNRSKRPEIFVRNLRRLTRVLQSQPSEVALVRNLTEYRRARAAGLHAAFIGVQGGNALDRDLDALDLIPDDSVLRITVLHGNSSDLGATSTPYRGKPPDEGLTHLGRDYVKRLDEKRIFVDLAHISRRSFFDAVEVHDPSLPLIVTHTGVKGVFPHWRNLDDEQLRAIAASGGTVGVMYHRPFLGRPQEAVDTHCVVDHLEHIVKTVGEDHASLGSDWDGAIRTPRDMPTCLELPRLVERMLGRGWSPDRVRKILSGNFLRTLGALRGDAEPRS